ncbi:MAG: hypothetical protein HS107_02835 [Thermoflexaceae bacterium]|nr:hypothetical protein [Thermoflexaceae bacterium]
MAEKHLEADDPYAFVAVQFPTDPDVDTDEMMARCFVEEYALMGMPPGRMMQLFRSSYFAGTNRILQKRGEDFIQQIIDDVFGTVPAGEVS